MGVFGVALRRNLFLKPSFKVGVVVSMARKHRSKKSEKKKQRRQKKAREKRRARYK